MTHLFKSTLLNLFQVDALNDLPDIVLIAHFISILVVLYKITHDFVRLESVVLVLCGKHELEDLVKEQSVDKIAALLKAVTRLYSQVPYHKPTIILERRMEQVVENLLNCLHLRGFIFLDFCDAQQTLEAVEVVLQVLDLVMQDRFVQRLDQIKELLASVLTQCLHPLLLVLLTLDDAHTLLLNVVELVLKIHAFRFVDFEFVVVDGLLDSANHSDVLVLENLRYFLRYQFFLPIGFVETGQWARLVD